MAPQQPAVSQAALTGFGIAYEELGKLHADTPRDEVKTRAAPHSKNCDRQTCYHEPLSYVDARYVMDRLDSVVGPENWQRDHAMTESGKVSAGIGILIAGIGWVWKWDGAGETDIEGEKGSFSDSFKRAAVSWGIARDLYPKADSAPQPARQPARAAATREPEWQGQDDSDMDGRCPVHETPWVLKPGGISKQTQKAYDPFWACAFRPQRGEKFCNEKPSKAWVARQGTAA